MGSRTKVEMTIRAKAFAGEGVRTHRVLVDDVAVRVYDRAVGHYTTCHSLSEAAERRIRKLAAAASGRS